MYSLLKESLANRLVVFWWMVGVAMGHSGHAVDCLQSRSACQSKLNLLSLQTPDRQF